MNILNGNNMFQPIHYLAMVPGNKYKIGDLTGIYIKTWGTYLKFFIPKREDTRRFRFFSNSCIFYEFVPQAQWQMERRSVNMILRRLIGDEYFTW